MAGEFDFSRFAVGGATRPDTFTGLSPNFRSSLAQMLAAAPPEIQQNLRIASGFRSPDRQAQLWQQALAKYGSAEAARKWVAPPGRSKHNHGAAVDLKYLSPEATKWAHANAGQFGLRFPLGNENWHIEPIGARGGHQHGPVAGTSVPMMAQGAAPPVAGSPLAALYASAQGPAQPVAPQPQETFGTIALAFAQQQADRQRRQREAEEADQARRAALFSQDSLAGLFG